MTTQDLQLNINAKTSGAEGSVKSLKAQLREAQSEVQALSDKFGATSKQATEAAKRAADLKDRIGDAKALSDAFNPDAKFKALTSSLAGAAGGFAAVQGAMGLIGTESKDVEKMLLKVQSAMAISQGLQSVGESIDAFKNLGAVIKNTSIFQSAYNFIQNGFNVVQAESIPIVVAETAALETQAVATTQVAVATTGATFAMKAFRLALIASGIGLLVVALGLAYEAFSKFTGGAEKAAKAQEKLNEKIAAGAKVQLDAEKQFIDNQEKLDIAKAKARGASEKEIFDIEQSYKKQRIESLQRYHNEVKDADKKAASETVNEINKINIDGQVAGLERQAQLRKEYNERKQQEEIDAAVAEKKAIDDALSDYEKRKAKRLSIEPLGADGLTEKEREKQKQKDLENTKLSQEQYNKLLVNSTKDGLGKVLEIKAAAYNDSLNKDKEKADAEKYIDELTVENKQQTAFLIADITAGLSSLIGQNSAEGKAIAIASATIDTYLSASTLFKQASKNPITIVNPAYPYLVAAPAVLAGIARVRQISQVQLPKGGGGGVPSMSASAPSMPQLPQTTTTNISQQSINDIGNQAVRAYVIENDVTSNQQRIEAIRQRARFS